MRQGDDGAAKLFSGADLGDAIARMDRAQIETVMREALAGVDEVLRNAEKELIRAAVQRRRTALSIETTQAQLQESPGQAQSAVQSGLAAQLRRLEESERLAAARCREIQEGVAETRLRRNEMEESLRYYIDGRWRHARDARLFRASASTAQRIAVEQALGGFMLALRAVNLFAASIGAGLPRAERGAGSAAPARGSQGARLAPRKSASLAQVS